MNSESPKTLSEKDVITEVEDRQRRVSNIIGYNLPEPEVTVDNKMICRVLWIRFHVLELTTKLFWINATE